MPGLMRWLGLDEPLEVKLFQAIEREDLPAVRQVLAQGPDKTATFGVIRDSHGRWVLARTTETAIARAGEAIVWREGQPFPIRLMTAAEFAHWCDHEDRTRTHPKTKSRLSEITEALVDAGFSPPKGYLSRELAQAVAANNAKGAKRLLVAKADPNYEHDGNLPVVTAVLKASARIVTLLLEHGADVNAMSAVHEGKQFVPTQEFSDIDYDGHMAEQTIRWGGLTLLMLAVERGDRDLVNLLIDRGADVNAKDIQGETALTKSRRKGDPAITQMLLASGAM